MNSIIVGAYWGDEGKGKIVDLIAAHAKWVVRYNGGDNAGHTIVAEGKKVILHILPSGVLQGKNVAIGPDVFFNPESFVKDYEEVVNKGFGVSGRVLIDSRAHLILPYHIALDAASEGSGKIGTTKRGIGPVAKDKASRTESLRVADLVSPNFSEKLISVLQLKKDELIKAKIILSENELNSYADSIIKKYSEYIPRIEHVLGDVSYELNEAISHGHTVILEGAQGTLLDIVHGTRPFVTSSNTTAGGAYASIGIRPKGFKVIGIVKAYPTRVGEGPFPTQLDDELGAKIQKDGHEFGATTGRPRKAGMPDFVALKYCAMINGVDEWVITKADVLAGKKFKAAIAYDVDGMKTDRFPFDLEKARPVYDKEYFFKEFSEEDAIEMVEKGYDALPEGMKEYLKDIVHYTKVPISMVSLSPKREITVTKNVLERTREYL